jgi:hypothetical protein
MKFTLSDCLARINQVLNYPAVTYGDVSHFFDQAISELNTSLRISLPSVSEMQADHTFNVTNHPGLIRLTSRPDSNTAIKHYSEKPNTRVDADGNGIYVCAEFGKHKFYKWDVDEWISVPALYGMYIANNVAEFYSAVAINTHQAVWVPVESSYVKEFDLTDYMPTDWWNLFIIPYVCFKFSVRNGDSGALFADEYIQGYQQLQSSYNVPNTVRLANVAGKTAYTSIVEQNLDHLDIVVGTRAIYETMKIPNGIGAVYGDLYSTGGWL